MSEENIGYVLKRNTKKHRKLDKSKRGRFFITKDLIEEFPALVRILMGKCIIVRCEHHFDTGCVEYIAYSNLFKHVPEGEKAPFYTMTVSGSNKVKAIYGDIYE